MAGLGIAAASALLPMIMKTIGLGGGRSQGAGRYIGGRRRRRRRRRRHRRYRGGGGVRGMRWGYRRCGRCARTHRCRRGRRTSRRGGATHVRWT